jgi:hypothetical protein
MPIGLGASLGIGGGRSATSSGALGGGGGLTNELAYPGGLWEESNYEISVAPEMHFDSLIIDGADAANNPSDDATIATWGDRSGNSTDYDATQGTGSLQPTYDTASPASVHFVIADKMVLANMLSSTTSTLVTVGYNPSELGAIIYEPIVADTTWQNSVWLKYGNTHDYLSGSGSGNLSTTRTEPRMHAVVTSSAGGTQTSKLYEEGGNLLISKTHTKTNDFESVGSGALAFPDSKFNELLVFDTALSTADLNIIKDYVVTKYSFTGYAAFS